MSWPRHLVVEIHRRSLWQVLGIYLVSAWGGFTAINELTEGLGLPRWVPPFAIVLFIIGLPVVLATAFVQEGMPTPGAARAPESDSETNDQRSAAAQSARTRSGALKAVLTWRRSLLAGVVAFALLGAGVAMVLALGAMGHGPAASLATRGLIGERDEILVADFEARASEPGLATTVAEALRVDLAQSNFIRVVARDRVREGLIRMQRADARLNEATALDLARRSGYKAVLTGDVNAAGSGYILSASLIAAATSEELFVHRETAADNRAVIGAIDRLSKKLRAHIGESLRSVNRAPPLARVTTASLEALTLYTQAVDAGWRGDWRLSVDLLERAIAEDTTFAMAWSNLGNGLVNRGGSEASAIDAFATAYRLRSRLPETERLHIEARYQDMAEGNIERARDLYRQLAERTGGSSPESNWAWREYVLGNYAESERLHKKLLADYPALALNYANQARTLFNEGKINEAFATLEQSRNMTGTRYTELAAELSLANFDFVAADTPSHPERLAGSNVARGRLRRALEHGTRLLQDRLVPWRSGSGELGALIQVVFLNNVHAARTRVGSVFDSTRWSSIQPLERPYLTFAEAYAMTGQPLRARQILTEYDSLESKRMRTLDVGTRLEVEAWTALAEDRPDLAAQVARRAAVANCPVCGLLPLGHAYERMGDADSAIVVFERYLNTPHEARGRLLRLILLGDTYERLARLHEQRGNADGARHYLAKLIDLWKEADAEIQPRVDAARRRLVALGHSG